MRKESSSLSKQYSRRIVAETLFRNAPLSRARLARETGLSKQTMSLVIAELEAEGWVRPIGLSKGTIGRSAVSYDLAHDAAVSIGVDLGGAKVSVALADLIGTSLTEATEPTDSRGGLHVFRQTLAMARRAAAGKNIDFARVRSIVVGMPGVVDPETGSVEFASNIRGLATLSAPRALADLFGQPVVIENDVNLAMLGEAWQGCAQGAENAAFLAIGTGVGVGLIVNGQIARGARGAAGEVAYLPIGDDLHSAEARRVGAFELEVGASGILRRYHDQSRSRVGSVRELFDRLQNGDAAALAVIEGGARSLALAITALSAVLDPELIVLGGSVGIRPELVERVKAALPDYFARPADVRVSALGARAGLVGALSLAVNRLHNALFGMSGVPGELSLPGSLPRRAAA
jgi:predicted NBD/HSP70 family sugar kinase